MYLIKEACGHDVWACVYNIFYDLENYSQIICTKKYGNVKLAFVFSLDKTGQGYLLLANKDDNVC